jgi:agmatine/peptidylarginine deiminase
MNYFKQAAAKWRMFVLFEPKDGVETFISPKFSDKDYQFIADILRKSWPQKEVI